MKGMVNLPQRQLAKLMFCGDRAAWFNITALGYLMRFIARPNARRNVDCVTVRDGDLTCAD
jgi:hypothetical protein